MEIHDGHRPAPDDYSLSVPINTFFERALAYSERYMKQGLDHYRQIEWSKIQDFEFWQDYIWCVYTSGFNARVVSQKINGLLAAYGHYTVVHRAKWRDVRQHIANVNKFNAIVETGKLITSLTYTRFRWMYLAKVDTIPLGCRHIGGITKYHLARNIGIDCVKPDLHLIRLAKHYRYQSDCHAMCEYLAEQYGERIGVVDFVLWAYCVAYGTKRIA